MSTAKHNTHHKHETHETTEDMPPPESPSEHDEVTPHNPPGGYNPPAMGGATQTYQMTSTVTYTFTQWEYYHLKMIH